MQNIFDIVADQAINKIEVTFWDNLNEPKTILGTAFWFRYNDSDILITNKHNFFPEMKNEDYKGYKVVRITIQLRKKDKNLFTKETSFIEVNLSEINGFVHKFADIALLINPSIRNSEFGYTPFTYDSFADENFLLIQSNYVIQ